MDIALCIPNVKLADLAVFLSNWIVISSCCNALSWPIPPIDQVKALESISNSLNSVSLYYESVDKLKI